MKKRVIMRGIHRAPEPLLRAFEDCGVYMAAEGAQDTDGEGRTVVVYAVEGRAELERRVADAAAAEPDEPFVVYTATDITPELGSALAAACCTGVITPDTPPEDISFILNRTFFHAAASGRNRRVSVNIPVTVREQGRTIETVASMLSREGAFINTLNPPGEGTECTVELRLPDGAAPAMTTARVLYSAGVNRDISIISNDAEPYRRLVSHPGMAVLFTGLTQGDADRIELFMASIVDTAFVPGKAHLKSDT